MRVKHGVSVIWLFFLINQLTAMPMKRTCRELKVHMVIYRSIIKSIQITLFPSFTPIPKTGDSFYCVPKKITSN